jgi:uncharacterized protein (TIGR00299 family) protein
MSRHLHWDPVGGASGDMILGALVDLGVAVGLDASTMLIGLPARLGLSGVTVSTSRSSRRGIAACKVAVEVGGESPVRHLREVRALLLAADLPEAAREQALGAFERLAVAEGKAHAQSPEQVHFHEVGADDALVDIAGACLLVHALKIERQSCGPLPFSHGTVAAAHGTIPLPAPAVLELLSGWPVAWVDGSGERVTPTGAALLATLARPGLAQDGVLIAAGSGAGSRDSTDRPNVLRAILQESHRADGDSAPEAITELVAAIDDATGEQLAHAAEILLGTGALDVYYAPLVMKKGRPGWQLTVLSSPATAGQLTRQILRHTSTAGVRRRDVSRTTLMRAYVEVETGYGRVRMKVFRAGEEELRAAPEYEDCREVARRADRPLEEIQDAARAAYRRHKGES